MQHNVDVRTAVADIHQTTVTDSRATAQLFKHRNLAVTRRRANNGLNLACIRGIAKSRSMNVIFGNDAGQCRLNDFLWRRREYVTTEVEALQILKRPQEQLDVCLQTNSRAHLDQVLLTNTAKLWVMEQEICELSTLLHKMNVR